MLDDRWLLWRVKCGSARSLRRLYSKYEADLLTLGANLLGRADLAEDVLQDVFIRFIKSLDTFELTGSLKGYLGTCVANRARDLLRRERCRPSGSLETAGRIATTRPGPLQKAIANEQHLKAVRRNGFMSVPFAKGIRFCAYSSSPHISKDFLKNPRNWFVQIGDSDVI